MIIWKRHLIRDLTQAILDAEGDALVEHVCDPNGDGTAYYSGKSKALYELADTYGILDEVTYTVRDRRFTRMERDVRLTDAQVSNSTD